MCDHVNETGACQARACDAVLHDQIGFDDRHKSLAEGAVRGSIRPGAADCERGPALRLKRSGNLVRRIVELNAVHSVGASVLSESTLRNRRRTAVLIGDVGTGVAIPRRHPGTERAQTTVRRTRLAAVAEKHHWRRKRTPPDSSTGNL